MLPFHLTTLQLKKKKYESIIQRQIHLFYRWQKETGTPQILENKEKERCQGKGYVGSRNSSTSITLRTRIRVTNHDSKIQEDALKILQTRQKNTLR